jgi:hypothetical protein
MSVTDLERLVSEDEVARAEVERAAAAARARVESARVRLTEARAAHLRVVERTVDDAVARILADAERAVAERRAHRERWMKEYAARADRLADAGAVLVAGILCERPRKKTL